MDYVGFPSLKFIHWTVKILCVPTVGIIVPSSKQTDYEMTINFGDMQISAVYPESTDPRCGVQEALDRRFRE